MSALRDARELERDYVVRTGVCIVGGGPAGLSAAHELIGTGVDVCVLEAGGTGPSGQRPTLPTGVLTREASFEGSVESRARALGGLANYWDTRLDTQEQANRSGLLDPIDFEQRDWVPLSGWPFDHAHLDSYCRRAQVLGGYGPYAYDVREWETGPDAQRLPLDPHGWETTCWMFGPTSAITRNLRDAVVRSPNVTPYVHASVVELALDADGREVKLARVRRPDGSDAWVAADFFVLATGGIENARLLLLSTARHANGIGNAHDLVGRHLMEHQFVHGGEIVPADSSLFDRMALYDERRVGDGLAMGKVQPTAALQRRERLLNISAAFMPKHRRHRRARQDAVDAFVALLADLSRGRKPTAWETRLRHVLRHGDYVAAALARRASGGRLFPYFTEGPHILDGGGWSRLPDKARRFDVLQVILHAEQAPHPDNRVTLGPDLDPLGTPRPVLHWEWREQDVDSVRRASLLLRDELRRSGIGEFRIAERDGRPDLENSGLHHPMGTTRMHQDPRHGVVDADARVHGVENLFVTGCSVFPTGGYVNPTLPIMALAVRVADHVRMRAGRTPPEIVSMAYDV